MNKPLETFGNLWKPQARYNDHWSVNDANRELTTHTAGTVSSRSRGQGL